LALLLPTVLGATLASAPALAGEKVKLTMFIWAGANQGVVPREVVAEYLKANPHVEIEFYESNNSVTYPKMVAARKVSPDRPLINFGYFNVDATSQGDIDDMWLPLDPKNVSHMKDFIPSMRRKQDIGIGYGVTAIGVMYNKNMVKQSPASWAALWDAKHRVTFFDTDWRPLIMAARLNGGDESNIEAGFKVWSQNAKNIVALARSNDQVKNLVVSGEAHVAPWFRSIQSIWEKEGAPLGFAVPKEGMVAWPIYLQIAKGTTSAQKRVAEEIINELLSPKWNARYCELTNRAPGNRSAKMAKDIESDPVYSRQNMEQLINLDWTTITRKQNEWRQRWDREVKSKM
jgi:putative spermidine/putrescine transport system substrate-binding protein